MDWGDSEFRQHSARWDLKIYHLFKSVSRVTGTKINSTCSVFKKRYKYIKHCINFQNGIIFWHWTPPLLVWFNLPILILWVQFRCYGGTEILLHDAGACYSSSSSVRMTSVCGSSVSAVRYFLCGFRNLSFLDWSDAARCSIGSDCMCALCAWGSEMSDTRYLKASESKREEWMKPCLYPLQMLACLAS